MINAMRHDRVHHPITLIRQRKLPAIAATALLALPLLVLMVLRRDAVMWMGEATWIMIATITAVALSLAVARLFDPTPLMQITPEGVEIPKMLVHPIRWQDIARIQSATRRGKTGDIHDRLLFHFRHPQIVVWKTPKLRRILGETPQAAVAIDITLIWPLRADEIRKILRDAARTYAKAPEIQSSGGATYHRRRIALKTISLLFSLLIPIGFHFTDSGLPRQFSKGLDAYRAGDVLTALPHLETDARAGDTESANALGNLYLNGDGVIRNTALAAGWFRRAAENGHAEAAYNLGNAYRLGLGTPEDLDVAIEWYERAANGGSSIAAFTLGNIYRLGDGVIRDYRQAIYWLKMAAGNGYAPAEHNLGRLYQEGIVVSRDITTAQDWYNRAASRGYAPARYDLARLMLDGDTKQRTVGIAYLIDAAESGYAPAQRRLASAYFNGRGVPVDPVIAYQWISLAERSWPASTRADLVREKARIAASLDAEQTNLAKANIRAWRPANKLN